MGEKERLIYGRVGFTKMEVNEFRIMFRDHATQAGELSLDELRRLLAKLVPMKDGSSLLQELAGLFNKFDENCNGLLDFPEFLQLLRRLQDVNFGEMNRTAAA